MVFRKRNSRKGQAAIEFLMTYGWMLLVVLIVGALIFSFVDFGSLLPAKLDLSNSFKGDAQRLVSSASTNELQFVVRYVGARSAQMEIDNVSGKNPQFEAIGGKSCAFNNLVTNSNTYYANASTKQTVTFVNGQEGVITFSCSSNDYYSASATASSPNNLIQGDVMEGDVLIKYADPRTDSLTLVSAGHLRVAITQ